MADSDDSTDYNDSIKSVIKFILNNSVDKLPIKKPDIVANVLKGDKKLFSIILEKIKTDLKTIYGIKLTEVPNLKPISYICTSEFTSSSTLEYTKKQKSEITLLFIILSYIFMKGTPISEANLYEFLDKLHIDVDETHSYFGSNIKKMINETFVRQLYLKKEKVVFETSPDEIVFSWGFRSTIEFPKKEILAQVSKIMGRPEICFVQQHREVYGDDVEMDNCSQEQK